MLRKQRDVLLKGLYSPAVPIQVMLTWECLVIQLKCMTQQHSESNLKRNMFDKTALEAELKECRKFCKMCGKNDKK